jgi:cytoskeletal protein RodZ
MPTFFQELRTAREAKGISLQQIAELTLINSKFLEAIEQGNVTVLPQTYVRAFIREYAAVVGLNPAEVLRKYDEVTGGVQHPLGVQENTPEDHASVGMIEPEGNRRPDRRTVITRAATVFAIVAAGLIVIDQLFLQRPSPPATEVPFQQMVAENEQRSARKPAEPVRTVSTPPATAPGDSLVLRATFSDSVWVQMVVDREQPHEYMFIPKNRYSWKARQRFVVTLGNAGAAEFTLDDKVLGTLGGRGAVVRDVVLTRESSKQ